MNTSLLHNNFSVWSTIAFPRGHEQESWGEGIYLSRLDIRQKEPGTGCCHLNIHWHNKNRKHQRVKMCTKGFRDVVPFSLSFSELTFQVFFWLRSKTDSVATEINLLEQMDSWMCHRKQSKWEALLVHACVGVCWLILLNRPWDTVW